MLAAFLLAGVAVNALVAWSCALFAPLRHSIIEEMLAIQTERYRVLTADWMTERGADGWWAPSVATETHAGFGVTRVDLRGTPYPVGTNPPEPIRWSDYGIIPHVTPSNPKIVEWTCGWPWPTFAGSELTFLPTPRRTGLLDVSGLSGGRVAPDRARLPVRPIWFGLLANTLVYGLGLWALLVFPGALRRARRRSRGQCMACAYPMGAGGVCSECGATTVAPSRVSWLRLVAATGAGAALSLAVALACAWLQTPGVTMVVDGEFERGPARAGPRWYWPLADWEEQMGTIRRAGAFGLDIEGRMVDSHPVPPSLRPIVHVTTAGWPWRCLGGRTVGQRAPIAVGGVVRGPPDDTIIAAGARLIPLTPIWRGLLLNTLVYGAVITVALAVFTCRWPRPRATTS